LLRRIADQQGLTPGVHPGFTRLARSTAQDGEGTSRARKGRRR
jgi:hypothetical protein